MSLQELKSKRKSSMDALLKKMEDANQSGYSEDQEKYWKPSVGKDGNGQFIIRFLPECKGEESPVVHLYSHFFQGPGGYYVENSLTTLARGTADPCSEYNSMLWNSVDSDNTPERQQVRRQKRNLNYYSNILVVKDPANPENEGKVFLFKYGKKIHDMIAKKLKPVYDDEEKVNIFDFWEGANFRMRISTVRGSDGRSYWNYDDSTFDSPSALSDDDDKLEEIWQQQHSLDEIVAPDKFKSYDELKERLNKVLGLTGATPPKPNPKPEPVKQQSSEEFLDDDIPFDVESKSSVDDDDDLSVFASLMDDD